MQKQSVNIIDEFYFPDFARDPLCSYVDEGQKNEIYFLNDFIVITSKNCVTFCLQIHNLCSFNQPLHSNHGARQK